MKKKWIVYLSAFAMVFMPLSIHAEGSTLIQTPNEPQSLTETEGDQKSYWPVVVAEDWGPAVKKIVLEGYEDSELSNYTVSVRRTLQEDVLEAGNADLVSVYQSDAKGNADGKGYTTLELRVHPEYTLTSPFNFEIDFMMNTWVDIHFEVKHTSGSIWDQDQGMIQTAIDQMELGFMEYTDAVYGDMNLGYASYTPKTTQSKKPLIVWLHGMGEGGDDPRMIPLGNKAAAFLEDSIQDEFEGAYVLMPQAPTFWLDGGDGEFTQTGESMYTQGLKAMIDAYVAQHENIDTNRIYIGGGSNGGFMTVRMMLDYPGYFAAGFPIAEAFADASLSNEDIKTLRDTPMWFVQSEDDQLVNHEENASSTVQRLRGYAARDVRYTLYASIFDHTGNINNEEGDPFQYDGHFSWIPVLNNEVTDEHGEKLFTWLNEQTLDRPKKSYFWHDNGGAVIAIGLTGAIVFGITRKKNQKMNVHKK